MKSISSPLSAGSSETAVTADANFPHAPARRNVFNALLKAIAAIGFLLLGWQAIDQFFLSPKYPDPPEIKAPIADPLVAKEIQKTTQSVREAKFSPIRWGMLGMVLQVHDHPLEAQQAYATAAKLDPNEAMWPYYSGHSLASSAPQEAIPHLRQAVKLSGPGNHSAALLLAEVLLDQGEYDEAEALFSAVMAEKPTAPRILLGLGRIAFDRGEMQEARQFFEQVVQKAPSYKGGYTRLAAVYLRLGMDDQATMASARAATLRENLPWADPYIDQLTTMKVGIAADMDRVSRMVAEGDYTNAQKISEQLVKDYPKDPAAWTSLGAFYMSLNRPKDAERALKTALDLATPQADTLTMMASAVRIDGRPAEAEAYLREAVRVAPNDVNSQYILGLTIAEQGRLQDSIPVLNKAIELNVTMIEARMALAQVYASLGRMDDAREQATAILRLEPQNPLAQELLAAPANPETSPKPSPATPSGTQSPTAAPGKN